MTGEVTDDRFFGGRLKLLQPRRGHRVGGDAALLAAAARSRMAEGASVVDLGAGVGAVGLGLRLFGAGSVALVEIDAELSMLSERNAERNGLSNGVLVACCDVRALGLARGPLEPRPGSADLVVANPPYDDARRFRASPDPSKKLAHAEDAGSFGDWAKAASRLLKPGGSFVAIHRPAALADILAALGRGFGDICVRAIHPRVEEPAARILIAARKGRRGALRLLRPIAMHETDGAFTRDIDAAQRGEAPISLD